MMTNIPKSQYLQLLRYQITDANFKIDNDVSQQNIPKKILYNLNIEPKLEDIQQISDEKFGGKVRLKISIIGKESEKDRVVHSVNVVIYGYFEGSCDNQRQFKKLCELNGVANLLLIARSFIASVTSQLNIKPIILPFFNLTHKK
ncbi:protein-export chaperone SecB [Thermosipho sp. 1074]|uniref:protein-export chaperone SecB n=1 Tax=Thermosipho sp. 1074 TaxID=1643331 RepID=UPI0009840C83|nr:protein-export chaperone SecB [Thermosipho sp. 1074]OOC42155.1 hypothetical protein XO08_07665 [Thermosipho sp. 1074]